MSTTYDADVYAWSREQAAIIRDLTKVRHLLPNTLDLEKVAEEIESVGSSELHAVQSQLKNVLVHLLKITSAPGAEMVPHWRSEIGTFHDELTQHYLPSMRQNIDLDDLWVRSRRRARLVLGRYGVKLVSGLPNTCPLELHELTVTSFEMDEGVKRIQAACKHDD